jgi:hypothetical protein
MNISPLQKKKLQFFQTNWTINIQPQSDTNYLEKTCILSTNKKQEAQNNEEHPSS